jgi:hypothetical protein
MFSIACVCVSAPGFTPPVAFCSRPAGVFSLFRSMPEHKVRRHRQREIREDDFSLTSQDACAPSQASGVKKTLSSVFSPFGEFR